MLIPPMVGREDALRKLREYSEKVASGEGVLVLISGEAGIGKTRLAEEFEKEVIGRGFKVMVGRCVPGTPTPYFPFLDAFKRSTDEENTNLSGSNRLITTIRKAAPDIAGATPIIGPYLRASASIYKEYSFAKDYKNITDPKTESEKTLFSMLDFLKRISVKQPLLLRIEDLQWADSGTIQVMHYLARNAAGLHVLLVGTYRSEEVGGEGAGEIHPLMESLRVMKRENICNEMSLKPLSQEELGMAIWGMLGKPLDDMLLRQIASESGGNPLFASEVVSLLVETGALRDEGGIWVAKGSAPLDIPMTVTEVALRRLEKLSKEERRLLECASVDGVHFHISTLQEILGMNRLQILEHLDSLEREHQLVRPSESDFQFNHEVVCKVVYEHIAIPRRKELHRVVGTSLEKSSNGETNYGLLSWHFFKADEKEKCIKYSILAGKDCLWQLSMPEAASYFQRVLDCASDGDAYHDGKLQALEGLGDAYASEELVKCDKAISYYKKCLAEATDPKAKSRLLRKMGWCWRPDQLGMGDSARARELLREAESYQDLDPDERAEILSTKMRLAHYDCNWDEADVYSTEAEELFESIGAQERLAMMLVDHATIDLCRGLVKQAFGRLERASSINSKYPSVGGETAIALSYSLAHMHRGEYEKASLFFSKVMKISDETGAYGSKHSVSFYKALLHDINEDFESAMAEALRNYEFAVIAESDYMRLASCVLLIHSYLRLNMVPEAQAKGLEMLELVKKFNLKMRSLTRNLTEIVQAELCYSNGNREEGNRRFESGIDLVRTGYYSVLFEGVTRTWYGEYLARQGRNDVAKMQYSKAKEIYERLENAIEVERVLKKLSSIS